MGKAAISVLSCAALALDLASQPLRAQTAPDGRYSMTLTLVDGFTTHCGNIPNAERTMTVAAGAVSMPLSPRGAPFKGTIASDGTIAATMRSPTTGGTMSLSAKLGGGEIAGSITGDGGCRFDLTGRVAEIRN